VRERHETRREDLAPAEAVAPVGLAVVAARDGIRQPGHEERDHAGRERGDQRRQHDHGTNDAQKTMGVITLALIMAGWQDSDHSDPQTWVIFACAFTIALGTYMGGWRIIRTLGKGLTDVKPAQGFSAETSTAATILASSALGFALSTTQVASGSVIGSGLGRRGSKVRPEQPDDDRDGEHRVDRDAPVPEPHDQQRGGGSHGGRGWEGQHPADGDAPDSSSGCSGGRAATRWTPRTP
jgi:hypothetical protein